MPHQPRARKPSKPKRRSRPHKLPGKAPARTMADICQCPLERGPHKRTRECATAYDRIIAAMFRKGGEQ